MKIEYRKLSDKGTASWQVLTNPDELIWEGVYALRVSDDDGTSSFPRRFNDNDTVTLVVKDHAHEGALQQNRTIVQTITCVECTTGDVLTYTRTRYNADGTPCWSYWALATENGAVINIQPATSSALGGVIVGDGLTVDATGKISIAERSVVEKNISDDFANRIDKIEKDATLASTLSANNGVVLRLGALIENSDSYGRTDYRAYTNKILANGEMLVLNKGYKITAVKIFDGTQELSFISQLNESEYPLDGKGYYYQFEFARNNSSALYNDELSQIIKSFLRKPFTWSADSNIDHFTSQGTYNISGIRTNTGDGLPIYNTGKIEARLTVLENDNCVTQVLTMLNVGGGDGNVYVRTRQGNVWEHWGKLQTNVEVGAVGLGQSKSFDDLTDNGIYTGANIYATGTDDNGYPVTAYEAFVLVVINAYLTGGGISQLKYSLLPDGTTGVVTRTKLNGEWSEWKDIADVKDGAVTAEKLSADVREKVENPLRPLYIAAGAEYNDSDKPIEKVAFWGEKVKHLPGHYYLNGLGDITEEQMIHIYNYKDAIKYLPKREGYRNSPARTYFTPCEISGQKDSQYTHSAFVNNLNLETVVWTTLNTDINTLSVSYMYNSQGSHSMFYGCDKLRVIYPMNVKYATTIETSNFNGCSSLIEVRLFNLMLNTGFKDSSDISKQSILYIVDNAVPITAITIILHPDAYARLTNDDDIVAALEAQPLVSLVSA